MGGDVVARASRRSGLVYPGGGKEAVTLLEDFLDGRKIQLWRKHP
jgi:hypothetical protein